jgi:hypothetical protein
LFEFLNFIKCLEIISTYNNELKLKGFNVFQIEKDTNATKAYSGKDFYKICLTTGRSRIHYADRSYNTEGYHCKMYDIARE